MNSGLGNMTNEFSPQQKDMKAAEEAKARLISFYERQFAQSKTSRLLTGEFHFSAEDKKEAYVDAIIAIDNLLVPSGSAVEEASVMWTFNGLAYGPEAQARATKGIKWYGLFAYVPKFLGGPGKWSLQSTTLHDVPLQKLLENTSSAMQKDEAKLMAAQYINRHAMHISRMGTLRAQGMSSLDDEGGYAGIVDQPVGLGNIFSEIESIKTSASTMTEVAQARGEKDLSFAMSYASSFLRIMGFKSFFRHGS